MKNRYVNLGKFLHWRVVYKYWILLTIFVQMIIMIFGFNVYTNLITLMIVAVGGTILGLLGLYCKAKGMDKCFVDVGIVSFAVCGIYCGNFYVVGL